jgi:hypothetical protein
LVGNLGELAARRCQVRRGCAQVTLQLRHPCFKCHLLASGGLGGVTGGRLGCGRSGLGPLGSLLSKRCGCSKLLNLGPGECQPRHQRVLLGGGRGGGSLGGGGAILCSLAGSFKGCPHTRLTRHSCSRRNLSHDKLHLQLSLFRTELSYLAGTSPTR